MSESFISTGKIVLHPTKPEWGPGIVVRIDSGRAHVVWRDDGEQYARVMVVGAGGVRLVVAPTQSDAQLDNIPPLVEEGGKLRLPQPRMNWQMVLNYFLEMYPLGFEDPDYLGGKDYGERDYKVQAHEFWVEHLGGDKLASAIEGDMAELSAMALRCISKVNLLGVFELSALKDAFQDEAATRRYFEALHRMLDASEISEELFSPYAHAVCELPAERGRVASWPVATILPFLAQPNRFMFLKPSVTNGAAEALGFNLHYDATPNWLTYRYLLLLTEMCRDKLAVYKPRDMIDLQSFIWVACGGYERFIAG